jgi:thiol-disulfide isomerase/thioredoxin
MRVALLVAAVAVLALVGCSGPASTDSAPPPSPFESCPATAGTARPATSGGGSAGEPMPAVTLACFTGGEPVALAALGRPAVINMWASYCAPCRTELPELQAFADEAGERVVVLGVVTGDTWNAAAYAGADFGVTFPSVFDSDRALLSALGRNAIPVTLFVDADGVVRHIDVSGALTLPTLRALAEKHLAIAG